MPTEADGFWLWFAAVKLISVFLRSPQGHGKRARLRYTERSCTSGLYSGSGLGPIFSANKAWALEPSKRCPPRLCCEPDSVFQRRCDSKNAWRLSEQMDPVNLPVGGALRC